MAPEGWSAHDPFLADPQETIDRWLRDHLREDLEVELLQAEIGWTAEELEAFRLLRQASVLILQLPAVTGRESSITFDRAELADKLHQVQDALLARPAIRALNGARAEVAEKLLEVDPG